VEQTQTQTCKYYASLATVIKQLKRIRPAG
jgi:hypothetical protein